MSVDTTPNAFNALNNNAAAAMDAIIAPRMEKFIASIDDFINNYIIEPLGNLAGAAATKAMDGVAAMREASSRVASAAKENFSAFSEKSGPAIEEPQIARSKQISQEVSVPAIPEQAKEAVMAMNNSQVIASSHVPESMLCNISPSVGGYAQSTGQGYSMSA